MYKEAVCFLSKINEEEIEEMQKPWKKWIYTLIYISIIIIFIIIKMTS